MNSPLTTGIGMTSARTRERLIRRLRAEGITDTAVLNAMRQVPRHLFVDEALASRAYEDTALPIGYGQTISQPYVVAWMTQALLAEGPLDNVLEIGTGCGYQAAILATLVTQVYSVERIEPLLDRARRLLRKLNIRNVRFKLSDGSWGWQEHAPYTGILVAAAPEEIPQALLQQLAIGGRLVIPIGPPGRQELVVVTRREQVFEKQVLGLVSFVPLVSGEL